METHEQNIKQTNKRQLSKTKFKLYIFYAHKQQTSIWRPAAALVAGDVAVE